MTDTVNQAKGDKGPEDLKPSQSRFLMYFSTCRPEMLTMSSFVPLHLCKDVGQGQERVLSDGDFGREERFDDHAQYVLSMPREMKRKGGIEYPAEGREEVEAAEKKTIRSRVLI